jgi:spermidine synthase
VVHNPPLDAFRGCTTRRSAELGEVARAESPRGEVVLRRRAARDREARDDEGGVLEGGVLEGGVLELRVNGVFVMDTEQTTSERALATAALAEVTRPARVLVGGLGLGYTVAALLEDDRVASVTVVEIEEAVVGWMRDGTIPHGPSLVDDPRVEVVVGDVAAVIAGEGAAYDLVLLDVDNGPGYLVHDANARVYGAEMLAHARSRLTQAGALVIWSASRAPELHTAMREIFGSCGELVCDVDLQGRDEHYFLYLSHLPARG